MKKVIALLTDEKTKDICDLFLKGTEKAIYLGFWDKIKSNDDECVKAIVGAVNACIENTDKNTIVFACHKNDIDCIKSELNECNLILLKE